VIMIVIRSWHDVTIIEHSNDPTSTACDDGRVMTETDDFDEQHDFYPLDAMLERVLGTATCLSGCLSGCLLQPVLYQNGNS